MTTWGLDLQEMLKVMLKRSSLLLFIGISIQLSAQTIEAESRPYRFNVDMMMQLEGKSPKTNFHILPYKVQISKLLEKKLRNRKLKAYDPDNEHYRKLVEEAIQEVGLKAFNRSSIECLLIENDLKVQVHLADFKPFKISIPLNEVESFKNHFNEIEFSKHRLAMNQEEEFVVTYLHLYNPKNQKKYIFYNTEDGSVEAPSFSVSLPKEVR